MTKWCVTKWCVTKWCVKDGVRASPVPQVPRLPCKVTVDVAKCHACHANRRYMSPSATPATQIEGGCHQVPRLPRQQPRRPRVPPRPKRATGASPVPYVPRLAKVEVDVTKYHACHVKRRWMSPSATPATPTAAASPRSTPAQAHHRSHVPRLPRKVKIHVAKCHACHAN